MDHIGLIAGNGSFPVLFAREAKSRGIRITAVAHRGETLEALVAEVDALTWVRVGQLGKMISAFRRAGITRAVMVGGLNKVHSLRSFRPDWRGIRFLRRAAGMGDDVLLRTLASEFESDGIEIVPSTIFLDRIVAAAGPIAGPKPNPAAFDDIRLGARVLETTGVLDVGQCVVVEGGVVLAIEAVEGSDAAIARGGALGRGAAVVVKRAKPGQDLRFDVPAVGAKTMETMHASGATTLAIEAGSTIILEGDRFSVLADRYGIAVVGCDAHGELSDG